MASQVMIFRCAIISPGDVVAERDAVEEAVKNWNAQTGKQLDARVEVSRWEVDAAPELGRHAQAAINEQVIDGCDLGIAIFWSRLGTATPTAPSGSVEEIDRLATAGARVLVYFCNRDIPQGRLDPEQYARLNAVRSDLQKRGLLGSFETADSLRNQLMLDLTEAVVRLLKRAEVAKHPGMATIGLATAPTPDIRIGVDAVEFFAPRGATITEGLGDDAFGLLQVSIRNFSPTTFFLRAVSFAERASERRFMPLRDALGNLASGDALIESQNSKTILFSNSQVTQVFARHPVVDAIVVYDALSREYWSNPGDLAKAVAEQRKPRIR